MRKITIELSDKEVETITSFMPWLDKFSHVIPTPLLGVVRKVKDAIG